MSLASFVPGMSGLGAFGDWAWVMDQFEQAKGIASRTGDTDGARRLIDSAWAHYTGGGPGNAWDYYQDALAYVETFRSNVIQAGYGTASGAEANRLSAGIGPIDTGSGDVARDAASGTFSDASVLASPLALLFGGGQGAVGGAVSDMTGGVPGDTVGGRVQRTVLGGGSGEAPVDFLRRKKCEATGGTWNQEAQACTGGDSLLSCAILPEPLGWMCRNPGKTTAAFVGLVGAWFLGPPIVGKIVQLGRAAS